MRKRKVIGSGMQGSAAWTPEDEEKALAAGLAAQAKQLEEKLEKWGRAPSTSGRPSERNPRTLDDAYRVLVAELEALSPRWDEELAELRSAYERFTDAVNGLWLYAERCVTPRVVKAWKAKNRKRMSAAGVASDEISAEATFAIRQELIAFARHGRGEARLVTYARRGVFAALDRFVDDRLTAAPSSSRQERRKRGRRRESDSQSLHHFEPSYDDGTSE